MRDYQKLKRRKIIKLAAIYAIMVVAVAVIVTSIVFFILGYRFDIDNGQIEKYALLQFNSVPSSASVKVDGVLMSSKTPNKISLPAGKHEIIMQRDGYEEWRKSVDVMAGTMTWLNYAMLVPKNITVEPVFSYASLSSSLASPKGADILIQENSNQAIFDLIDISSDTAKLTKLTMPATIYNVANSHVFKLKKWDDGGRYVLVEHDYDASVEWLVLDTQNVNASKNVTKSLNIAISDIDFFGTSGNVFYALSLGNIHKINLSNGTISKALIGSVEHFGLYDQTNVITFVGLDANGKRVAGMYRDGDNKSHVIRTVETGGNLQIATTHYFNEDYIAILENSKLDVYGGSYPNDSTSGLATMKPITSLSYENIDGKIAFSPTGEYVIVKSGADFMSFDLEYQKTATSNVDGSGSLSKLDWLDNNHLWSDRDGKLMICEFDGANSHVINSMLMGQDATITHNGRYLYSLNKVGDVYQLQRVRLILP